MDHDASLHECLDLSHDAGDPVRGVFFKTFIEVAEVFMRAISRRCAGSHESGHAQSEHCAKQQCCSHEQLRSMILPIKDNVNSSEKQKINNPIDRSLKPRAEWRIGELDAGNHAVHFVEQSGYKEQQSSEDIPPVSP